MRQPRLWRSSSRRSVLQRSSFRRSLFRKSRLWFVPVVTGAVLLLSSQALQSQQDSISKRKIIVRTAAEYPALARSLALEGVVKVDALVGPDGSVKSVDVKGGHPVLVQAAIKTVNRWKWEPAAHDTHELVEVKFSPAD
jgi:TonB family protein